MSDKTLINIERLRAHERRKTADSAPAYGGSLLQHLAGVLAQLTPVYRCVNMRPRRTLDAYHHYQNENWKTINHAKVLLDGKGKIKGGAGGKFNGRRFGAKWRFKKKSTPNTRMVAATRPISAAAAPTRQLLQGLRRPSPPRVLLAIRSSTASPWWESSIQKEYTALIV